MFPEEAESEELPANFEMMGYESLLCIKNLGNLFLYQLWYPFGLVLLLTLKLLKSTCSM
jgi:hypothetical protein